MGPLPKIKSDRERKVKELLKFAEVFKLALQDRTSSTATLKELPSIIQSLPLTVSATSSASAEALDRAGTELWNLSTRLHRERDHNAVDKTSLCQLRTFAFLLIDSAHASVRSKKTDIVRALKVALKAAKVCLDGEELELALKVLERVAHYEHGLEGDPVHEDIDEEEKEVHRRLYIEYVTLRMALSWKQSRLDLSENMYSKYEGMAASLDPASAEKLADLLYEIGTQQLKAKRYDQASKWLERAYNILEVQDMDRLSNDAGELRLCVLQNLVTALHSVNTVESQSKAEHVLRLLESDYGDKLVVSILKLELLSSDKEFSPHDYSGVLSRMIPAIILTNANFKTVMHHIHRVRARDQRLACALLDQLIEQRLFEAEKPVWLEKAAVTRIWLSISSPGDDNFVQAVHSFLDRISENSRLTFSTTATHAAQTLIWKAIETACTQEKYDSAEKCCRLATHRLFEKSGEMNKQKIARKLISCATARHDFASAREAFYMLSETGQTNVMTQYLMFKVALRCDDKELAASTLESICRQSTQDTSILYACIMDAQLVNNRRFATQALRKVVEDYRYHAPKGVYLPVLLRITIRLQMGDLESVDTLESSVADDIADLIQAAAAQASEHKDESAESTRHFSENELEWFSKNSYNIALQHCAVLAPQTLTRLLTACMQFIELLELYDKGRPDNGLHLRKTLCNYLVLIAHLTLARGEDVIEASHQHYNTILHRAKTFRELTASEISNKNLGEAATADLISKYYQVIAFELEAALKLSKWDSLNPIFEELWRYEGIKHLEILADLVLIILASVPQHAGGENNGRNHNVKILKVLQRIIDTAFRQSPQDVNKLAKWIRCLYQVALTIDENISLQCIDQASDIARRGQCQEMFSALQTKVEAYPKDELEWLVTTSFNRAVDFYGTGDDHKCRLWAEKSLALAAVLGTGVGIHKMLMEKYGGLTWGEDSADAIR